MEIKANLSLRLVEVEAELGKNEIRVMNQVLYDIGPLTVVRRPLQRALKVELPFGQGFKLKTVNHTKINSYWWWRGLVSNDYSRPI